MDFIYPFFIAFILVFVSELGDKTQLLVLSFSSKLKARSILVGVGLGSLFSHGIAILFGSYLGNIQNNHFQYCLKIVTYLSFIVFGIAILLKKNYDEEYTNANNKKIKGIFKYILFIAFTIVVGELGDKTFLASIGLGIEYPIYKISLIFGAVSGMVISDLIAILFGKFLSNKIKESTMQKLSGTLFLTFGMFGIFNFIF